MKQHFLQLIQQLKENGRAEPIIIQTLLDRIERDENYIQSQNSTDHFCSFFLPYDSKTGRIFLTHHVKANDWIPPGGHMDPDETPEETVLREIQEELGISIQADQMELIDISMKIIENPALVCRFHYDFWFLVRIPEQKFDLEQGVFYDTAWMTFDEMKKRTKLPEYTKVMERIEKIIS